MDQSAFLEQFPASSSVCIPFSSSSRVYL
ncbi:hypothetical protein F383_38218 [Gossypium arboreum]|uniref:Uncharacterized protein n=1 Tax=Gossypium arboreum TaxID=29729 RepID=A0A0B0MFF2_GOSAR|nr:hypothetical protein F383_38218 [Gossypium arboreum]